MREQELDRLLNINTARMEQDWSRRREHPCQPTPMAALEAVAALLGPENHVVDCGCGTGRAAFALAYLARCKVTGVELNPRHFATAEENLRRCRRDVAGRVRLVCGPAQRYQPEPDADVYYFFNPFPAAVFRGVLTRIRESQLLHPRSVRLICYYPDDEWVAVLHECPDIRLEESVDLRSVLGRDPREMLLVACMNP